LIEDQTITLVKLQTCIYHYQYRTSGKIFTRLIQSNLKDMVTGSIVEYQNLIESW